MAIEDQFGAKLEYDITGGSTFVEVGRIRVTPSPTKFATKINTTTHSNLVDNSGEQTFISGGLKPEQPELAYEGVWDIADVQQAELKATAGTTTIPNFRVTLNSGSTFIFLALVLSFLHGPSAYDSTDPELFTLTLQPTGATAYG